MPQFMFYTVDEDGLFDEYIGTEDKASALYALKTALETNHPFDEYDVDEIECVIVDQTLSGREIEKNL